MRTRFLLLGLFLGVSLTFAGTYLFMQQKINALDEQLFEMEYLERTKYEDLLFLLQLIQNHPFNKIDFLNVEDTNYIVFLEVVPRGSGVGNFFIHNCSFSFDRDGVLTGAYYGHRWSQHDNQE